MDNLRAQFGSLDTDETDYGIGEDDPVREPPPSPIGQDERRMQVRAYNHWASLLADRNFPSIEDLEPAALPDFGPHSVLLDFTNGIENPGVRFLGAELAVECEVSQGIQHLDEVPHRSLLTRITDHYMQILANQAPIGFEAEFVNQRGATIMYRGILLPYSSDDDTIDFIYGVINWKEIADQLTSDELLLEIDNALEASEPEGPRAPDPVTDWADGPGVNETPVSPLAVKNTEDRFPQPAFGGSEDDEAEDGDEAGLYEAIEAVDDEPENASRFGSLLSLGGGGARNSFDEDDEDYGDDDDDDPVARWLARDATPLRDAEDTGFAETEAGDGEEPFELGAAIGMASFEEEPAEAAPFELVDQLDEGETDEFAAEIVDEFDANPLELVEEAFDEANDSPVEFEPEPDLAAAVTNSEAPSDIYDCLASARELAMAASTSEDRSRAALYAAVGRAYDFSLAAAAEPEEFAELMADSGLTMQDRAPMTPVVKLVFGADYDKTRIAEYASVLSFAHREGIERGALSGFLAGAEGGLKGVVQAERAAKKGGATPSRETPREALARKLRAIAPLGFEDIPAEGEEFAVVMIRRVGGEVVVLGEVADVPLVEKVGKKLVA